MRKVVKKYLPKKQALMNAKAIPTKSSGVIANLKGKIFENNINKAPTKAESIAGTVLGGKSSFMRRVLNKATRKGAISVINCT
jgi:hypothetical protein